MFSLFPMGQQCHGKEFDCFGGKLSRKKIFTLKMFYYIELWLHRFVYPLCRKGRFRTKGKWYLEYEPKSVAKQTEKNNGQIYSRWKRSIHQRGLDNSRTREERVSPEALWKLLSLPRSFRQHLFNELISDLPSRGMPFSGPLFIKNTVPSNNSYSLEHFFESFHPSWI